MYRTYKKRDLTFIDIGEKSIVISCDSAGGIGNKPNDALKVEPYHVGALVARVGLMEVLSIGGVVLSISDGICNEMEPTGVEILKGIKDEAKKINFNDQGLTGSTEENFPTTMTGVALTVVGIIDNNRLSENTINKGDFLALCGLPKVGDEINLYGDKDLITYNDVEYFVKNKFVKDVIPCGSKGILYECETAVKGYKFLLEEKNDTIDIKKSCGPATCAVIIIDKECDMNFETEAPFNILGKII